MKKLMFMLAVAGVFLLSFQSCGSSRNDDDDDDTTGYNYETDGIQGHWLSEGENVAPLLSEYFDIERITASFYANSTYEVVSYNSNDVATTYSGTYTQTISSVAGIWDIVIFQTETSTATSEGIFRITRDGDDYTMEYEVVQTQPETSNTPPTATAGFGSSNGGDYGDQLIQIFVRTGDLQ